jgi:hypothetical protein
MIDRAEKSRSRGRELMRKRMNSYLAPVAAVLFRALAEAGPTAGLFLVAPTGSRGCRSAVSLCEINSPAAPSPAVAARSLSLRVYIVFGRGNPPVVARFDADAAPVRAPDQLPKESRGPVRRAASLNRTECVLN